MEAKASISGDPAGPMINRVLGRLGISFVQDRTACSLAACRIAVCPRPLRPGDGAVEAQARSGRKRRQRATDQACAGQACAVCADSATGLHYGAVTCDWCKEFFEQSVRHRQIYECHQNGACDLRLQRRNHCQGCRWDKCLEVGMVSSAICKSRALGGGIASSSKSADHRQRVSCPEYSSTEGKLHGDAWSNMATPQLSLPSPTDTESSSRYDSGDDEADRRLAQDLLGDGRHPELPIKADLVRDALTPLEGPETLGTRLTELERSCLVDLFLWNKRRLEGDRDRSNFGPAAANWLPIMLTSAVRHFLANSTTAADRCEDGGLAASGGFSAELEERLKWLLRGKEFDFEPLLDKLDCLLAQVGDLCRELLDAVVELRCDALGDIILMMGDNAEEDMPHSLQGQPVMLRVLRAVVNAAGKLKAAQPEQRALLLAALVSCEGGPDEVGLTRIRQSCQLHEPGEPAFSVPALFGL